MIKPAAETPETDTLPCEGCGKPSATHDVEGVPLCDDCAECCEFEGEN